MKYMKYLLGVALCSIGLSGCSNFEDINTNPDSSTNVNSSLLATGAIANFVKSSRTGKTFVSHQFISKYMGWGEGVMTGQYNDFGRTDFGDYSYLLDYKTMAEMAPAGYEESYKGLALLLKSYILFNHTMEVGDIPYSEILKGEEGLLTPVYDTQKDVFLGILKDLDEAYENLSVAKNFEGDIVFSGSAQQWAKIATALQLRVLIHLSKKESDTDLQVAKRFAEVYNRGNLMESNADNLQLVYSSKAGQLYPYHSSSNNHWSYAMLSDFLVDMLKENEDNRLFYFARPAQVKLDEGLDESSWDAYVGVDPMAPISIVKESYAKGTSCGLNDRYINYEPGEPFIRLGYAEQCFILAEAALRGWIDADANEFYKEGIRGSMKFISSNTPNEKLYHHGHPLTDEYVESFVSKESIQLSGNFNSDLEKIMKQKYIASFMQMPYQPYYDYRRTGYPVFPINEETSLNFNAPDKLPMRWQYPDVEISFNTENVEAAIKRQYGSDEVNKIMWILQ